MLTQSPKPLGGAGLQLWSAEEDTEQGREQAGHGSTMTAGEGTHELCVPQKELQP